MSPARDSIRIGDGEREQAAAVLAEHFAQGRLTHAEYAERFDAVWTARTQGDLRTLFHDLPGRATPLVSHGPGPRRHRGFRAPGALWLALGVLLVVLAVKMVFAVVWALFPVLLIVLVGVIAFRVGRGRRRRRRRVEWYERL